MGFNETVYDRLRWNNNDKQYALLHEKRWWMRLFIHLQYRYSEYLIVSDE